MPDISSLITIAALVVTAVAAVAATVIGWINREKIAEVHMIMNSRLDQLVETTERLALARGAKKALEDDKVARAAEEKAKLDDAAYRREPGSWR